MRIRVTPGVLLCVLLSSGCSTQHFTSVQPAEVVAACIAKDWQQRVVQQLGPHANVPVVTKENTNECFVGIRLPGMNEGVILTWGLAGLKHPLWSVWAEVTDTASGSKTLYHRALFNWPYHFDQGVRQCQETSQ